MRLVRRLAPILFVPVLASCSSFGAPSGGTQQGEAINHLWRIFFVAALSVAAVVYGLIVWSIVRYRRRSSAEELPPQFRANIPVEVIYTVIPVLVVIGLFAATFRTETKVEHVSSNPRVRVDALAFTWGWRFTYEGSGVTVASGPEGGPPQLVLPLGQTVRIHLTSNDVIHAFYVPGFLFKRDATPGHPTDFDFTPSRAGTYLGECAEFCGLDHAFMTFTVRVVTPGQFTVWLRQQAPA
jgi:cytochrome c oxidase subunit 2